MFVDILVGIIEPLLSNSSWSYSPGILVLRNAITIQIVGDAKYTSFHWQMLYSITMVNTLEARVWGEAGNGTWIGDTDGDSDSDRGVNGENDDIGGVE